MYTINSYRNNLKISPFLWLLLPYKQLWWSNVRWEFVLLSIFYLFIVSLTDQDDEAEEGLKIKLLGTGWLFRSQFKGFIIQVQSIQEVYNTERKCFSRKKTYEYMTILLFISSIVQSFNHNKHYIEYIKTIDKTYTYMFFSYGYNYSVRQSDENNFWGNIVLDSFNKTSRDEENFFYQI